MAKRSDRWKQVERDAAEVLGGVRVLRGGDFSESDVDVAIHDLPELKVDCKAYARFAHHSLLEEVRRKYCTSEGDVPVLVTKHSRQKGANVTVPISFFADLLDSHRALKRYTASMVEKLEVRAGGTGVDDADEADE